MSLSKISDLLQEKIDRNTETIGTNLRVSIIRVRVEEVRSTPTLDSLA